jgi:UDP-glucose 4-epimerase
VDNLVSGDKSNVNPDARFRAISVNDGDFALLVKEEKPDGIFHCAALARTPWCIDAPSLCFEANVRGTHSVLEAARMCGTPRVVLSSSNIVYAAETPYKASKLMGEQWARAYAETYKMSVISLRYSNVYGPRQSEKGPSPNVFASLRKRKRETGYVEITGDGEQSRDFTHVGDIVRAQLLAMNSSFCGEIDLCTGVNYTMNDVAKLFGGEVKYLPERPGDVKHIVQDPKPAFEKLGWRYRVTLKDGIKDCIEA